jgi:hypothetical protein
MKPFCAPKPARVHWLFCSSFCEQFLEKVIALSAMAAIELLASRMT